MVCCQTVTMPFMLLSKVFVMLIAEDLIYVNSCRAEVMDDQARTQLNYPW